MGLNNEFLERIASGLGWALQKDNQGVMRAFQWGDMGHLRADIAINLRDRTAVGFFAHSADAHILAHHITSPYVELNDGLKFISEKLGFAIKFEEGWKEKEKERFAKVNHYLALRTRAEGVNRSSLEFKSAYEDAKVSKEEEKLHSKDSPSASIFIPSKSKS